MMREVRHRGKPTRANDVRDNVYAFDDSSFLQGQQKPRPYFDPVTGEFEVRDPGPWLLQHSRVFRFAFKQLLALDSRHGWGMMRRIDGLDELSDDETAAAQRQGLAVVDQLLGRAMEAFPDVRFIGFAVDAGFEGPYRRLFEARGAGWLPDFYRHVEAVADTDCSPLDAHGNHEGHRVAGERMLELLPEAVR